MEQFPNDGLVLIRERLNRRQKETTISFVTFISPLKIELILKSFRICSVIYDIIY